MDTLDNVQKNISDTPPWQSAARYGLIGAGVLVVIGLIFQLSGFMESSMMLSGFLLLVVTLIITILTYVYAVKNRREKELGGSITFWEAFQVCLVVMLVMTIISAIWTYINMTFVDPEMMDRLSDAMVDTMEKFETPEAIIDQALADFEKEKDPMKQTIGALWKGPLFGGVVGIIVSLVMKKEKNNF